MNIPAPSAFDQVLGEALNGRRKGMVLCVFHQERTPSLSVNLDEGVFHCFGCDAKGGRLDFERRMVQAAGVGGYALAQQQPWAKEPVKTLNAIQDWIRRTRTEITSIRETATDDERGWALLAIAADLERAVLNAEQEVDAAMGW